MKKHSVLFLLLMIPFGFAVAASEPENKTIHCAQQEIISGDSLRCITSDQKEYLLKLAYLEAPKVSQRYGKEAKQALSDLLSGEDSRFARYGSGQQIEVVKRDEATKQMLVVLKIPMGNAHLISGGEKTMWGAVNYVMIEEGYAWHVPIKGENKENAAYAFPEKYAKADKKGIWSNANSLSQLRKKQRL